jgi:hypothetical protein
MPNQKDNTPEMMIIEICNQQDSGFVRDGTEGRPWEDRIKCAETHTIPSTGYRATYKIDAEGNKVRTGVEEVQYIEGIDEISIEKQREKGLLRPNSDVPIHGRSRIIITKGYRTLFDDGGDKGLFKYMNEVFWCEDAFGRSLKADKFFRISRPDLATEKLNEDEFIKAEAVMYCRGLCEKVGGKYVYQEDKIDALMHMFGVASTDFNYETKMNAITSFAKKAPQDFLNVAKKLEQTTLTEVHHAIDLNLIKVEKNVWMYVNKDKILHALGVGNFKMSQKITMLADHLRTVEGFEAYNELKAEVEFAKEKQLETE